MNSILLDPNLETSKNTYTCKDKYILEHIHSTLKATVGDRLKVTILGKGIFLSSVISLSNDKFTIKLSDQLPHKDQWFNLIIGASRPPTIKKILEHTSTMGVKDIHIFKAELSDKSFLQSKIYELESINKLLDLGLSQSAQYISRPQVTIHKYLPESLLINDSQKFILSLRENKSIKNYSLTNEETTLAIGPERGWTDKEEAIFINAGYSPLKVSNTILRVEHATYFGISQLEQHRL